MISVDTKKKELVGDFENGGRGLRPKGSPVPVRVHDFRDPELGKAVPYGIYGLAGDSGRVNVGVDHDTAQFAVASIRGWWETLGSQRCPDENTLTIIADCGRSNGYRTRLWKTELQRLAHDTALRIRVWRFPPGTSKWNRIEHRLFQLHHPDRRGKPLESLQVIVNLIRRDEHPHRPDRLRPTRRARLPQRRQDPQRPTRRRPDQRRPLPPRVQLHHQTHHLMIYES